MTLLSFNDYHFPRELKEVPEVLRHLDRDQRDIIREAAAKLVKAERLVWVGSGDCYFVGSAVVAAFESLAQLPTIAMEAFDMVSSPPVIDENTAIVGFSSSGKSVYTVEAIQNAAKSTSLTVAIVNEEHSPLAELASVVLGTKTGKSYTFPTKTTSIALALVVLLAAELGYQKGILTDVQVEEIWDELSNKTPSAMEQAQLSMLKQAAEVAPILDKARRIVVVGSGINRTTAMIGAAKFIETSAAAASANNAEEYLHLIGFGTNPKDAVVLIDDKKKRTRLVAQYTAKHKVPTIIVTDSPQEISTAAEYFLTVPSGLKIWTRLLIDITAMHMLGSAVAEHRGADPDNRNEVDLAYVINLLYAGSVDAWKGHTSRQEEAS